MLDTHTHMLDTHTHTHGVDALSLSKEAVQVGRLDKVSWPQTWEQFFQF